ncbi:TetR/AcrR family transcriptional regulator [Hydromonas duriensis]|uniref:TetR family transcriptional regulator n=1 Tax=Hydromonas duriensis TaxID=1527608 RepID=A0A4R6YAG1_9BURK|nr:TetR/AcrR family transcriptional regulator [Hydromonas duriensis]TDR32560.1 TetR family transcriptional regulator [Hydromonas duriensis]
MVITNNNTSNERSAVRKGEQTRLAILDVALEVAARDGLEGVTIGILADRLGMSKSGVFSHFGSREELLIATLKEYEHRFLNDVLKPAVKEARGLARLKTILGNWFTRLGHENEQGCLYISGGVEYDDRPGAVRDELVGMIARWEKELERAIRQAMETGELRDDVPIDLVIFELYGLALGFHHSARLMGRNNGSSLIRQIFERILKQYQRVT